MKIIKILLILASTLTVFNTQAKSSIKVLLVLTNHSELGQTGKKTGYFLSEVTHPYFKLKEAGFKVDFASLRGGLAPMDPKSLDLEDPLNKKFYKSKKLMRKVLRTKKLAKVKAKNYKAIVFSGGHGTMWDFPNSRAIDEITASIYENGGVVAAVCHGPAALVNVKLSDGTYLLDKKRVTGFTNKEERIVKLAQVVPFLLEDKMKKRGAKFVGVKPWNENVVVSDRLVTGQNPSSASKLGSEVVKLLKK